MSVGGLIRETLALVWRNAVRILVTAGVLLLPAELATAFAGDESTTAGGIAYAVVSLLVYPWAVGATAVSELASSPVIDGIASVALDLPFVAVFAAFAYAVYSRLPGGERAE